MIIKNLKLALTCLALAAPAATFGCATDQHGDESVGHLTMALTTTTSGTTYRLSAATFQIDGAVSTSLVTSNDPSETVLTAVLPVGDYTSTLASGWVLQRFDGGSYVPVDAVLVSANPAAFSITEGNATSLVFQFNTSGTIITIGTGTLNIGVAVTETTGGGSCTPFGSGCAAGEWCAPASLGGPSCVAGGPIAIGAACDGTEPCTVNGACGDLGSGQVCIELCSTASYGTACSSGGVCSDVGFTDLGACL